MIPSDVSRETVPNVSRETKPVLLDLFCGAGGATKGYMDAGFRVVGIDHKPQPDYPGDHFVQADAIDYLTAYGHKYDAIHASPPCQASCRLTSGTNQGLVYPNLIPITRHLLAKLAVPTVIENVLGSDLRRDLTLCGEMFGLKVQRHRYFELGGWQMEAPAHVPHRGRVKGWRHGVEYEGYYYSVHGKGGGKGTIPEWQDAMGIHWTAKRRSLAEAIPPAYTRFIGNALISATQPALEAAS